LRAEGQGCRVRGWGWYAGDLKDSEIILAADERAEGAAATCGVWGFT